MERGGYALSSTETESTMPRLLIACVVSLLIGCLAHAAERRPNVIVILADDLGYADVGFNGAKDIPTPNIDSLASSGIKFTQGYVSHPFCSPTRAGMLTGRYQHRFGHENNPAYDPADEKSGLPTDQITVADLMKQAGYATGIVGKWHLGAHPKFHPNRRGFDEFFGFIGGGHTYFPAARPEKGKPGSGGEYNVPIEFNGKDTHEAGYITTAFGREAAAFVERHKDQPFFLYLAFNAPHTPLMAPEDYLKKFESISDPKRKVYAAMVNAMDDAIGVLLAKLRERQLEESTLIFFMSDNGGPINEHSNGSSNAPLRGGKGMCYEGGVRVPFAVQWKGKIAGGRVSDQIVSSLDVLPTAVALAGGKLPTDRPIDGVDLTPYLTGEKTGSPHTTLIWRTVKAAYGVRDADMKLVQISGQAGSHLFDLAHDKAETTELTGRDADVQRLQATFTQWQSQMIDPVFQGPVQRGKKRGKD
jgi:arylsulfatase A-like enzyme